MTSYSINKTRTWKGRHAGRILRLEKAMQSCRIKHPFVVEIGPGAIAKKLAHLYPQVDEENRNFMDKKIHQAVAVIESRARDDPKSELITYETQEIYEMLQKNGGFSRYLVLDNNQRVLDAIKNQGLENVETLNWDIEKRLLVEEIKPIRADIVIAWKVLEYCGRSYCAALSNMLKIPKDNGIISLTIPEGQERQLNGYANTDLGTYVRKPNMFRPAPLDYERIARISISGSAGR